jgi:hypothetical protein
MLKKDLIFIAVLTLLCVNVYAHSGGTDWRGGHNDNSTGGYHYHHGYPEHQHPNGVCPYDDRYSDYSSEEEENEIQSLDEYCEENGIELSEKETEESTFKDILKVLVGFWWLIIPIVLGLFNSKKKK